MKTQAADLGPLMELLEAVKAMGLAVTALNYRAETGGTRWELVISGTAPDVDAAALDRRPA